MQLRGSLVRRVRAARLVGRSGVVVAALTLAPIALGGTAGLPAVQAQTGEVTTVAPIKESRFGGRVVVYENPDANAPAVGVLANGRNVFGRVVFTVVEQKEGWTKVNAPLRPGKGQTGPVQGWVRSDEISLFKHDYSITISVSQRQITVFKGSQVILSEKVAVGAPATPTPIGKFFTVDLVKPKNAAGAYGPFAYGLSGFSEVYQSFGTGDGRIGLHGTNAPKSIGTNTTNGCIRMSNAGITKLKGILPLGVPVNIVP